jgi:hypothetical protein
MTTHTPAAAAILPTKVNPSLRNFAQLHCATSRNFVQTLRPWHRLIQVEPAGFDRPWAHSIASD